MGKQKESFEVWSHGKRKGKVVTTANYEESPVVEGRKEVYEETQNSRQPKGKTKTGVALLRSTVVQEGMEDGGAEGCISPRRPRGTEGQKEFISRKETSGANKAAGKLSLPDNVSGKALALPMSVFDAGMQGFQKLGKQRSRTPQNMSEKSYRRPGKEKARSSSPSASWQLDSRSTGSTSESSGDHSRRSKRGRSYFSADSEEKARTSRVRRHQSKKKVSCRHSDDSHGSVSSESHVKGSRSKRAEFGVRGQHHEVEWVEKTARAFEHVNKNCGSESDEQTSVQKRSGGHVVRTYVVRRDSPTRVQELYGRFHCSENSESLFSNGEQKTYRLHSSNEKAMALKTESHETETEKRRGRRRRQGERDTKRQLRERQGLKGHYISVNHRGIPYSFGVGAWREEVKKLSMALDPSITNIRHQPEEHMATLRRRLKDNFEYSAPVDHAYIRQLAGKCVTQRRSRLLASMREGRECPAGLSKEVWRRLDRILQDPHREELSQRMRVANAARLTKGRTGPKGEEGIKEELYRQLGREPDPHELEFEMSRNKGYSGVAQKRREARERHNYTSIEGRGAHGEGPRRVDCLGEGGGDPMSHSRSEAGGRIEMYDFNYVWKMEQELDALKRKLSATAGSAIAEALPEAVQSMSMQVGVQESSFSMQAGNESTAILKEGTLLSEEEEEVNDKDRAMKKNTQSRRK